MFIDVSPRSPIELVRRADSLLAKLPQYIVERDILHRRVMLAAATFEQLAAVLRDARHVLGSPLSEYSMNRLRSWRSAAYAELAEVKTEHAWAAQACRTVPLIAEMGRRDLLPPCLPSEALTLFSAHVREVVQQHPDLHALAQQSGYLGDCDIEQPEDIEHHDHEDIHDIHDPLHEASA